MGPVLFPFLTFTLPFRFVNFDYSSLKNVVRHRILFDGRYIVNREMFLDFKVFKLGEKDPYVV